MNNFPISAIQQQKTTKHGHSSSLSTDTSHFNKELKASDQTSTIGQKANTLQNNLTSNSSDLLDNSTRYEMENHFDSILQKMSVLPLHLAIEPILTSIYTSYKSILWISKDFNSYSFYSPTLDFHITGEDTLLAAAARAKTSIVSPAMNNVKENKTDNSENDDFEQIESECSKMFFPLYLKSGNVIAVAEILRTESQNHFDDHDIKIASFLIRKFLLYGSALFNPSETVFFASEFSHIVSPNSLYKRLSSALIRGFTCKMVDFWCHHNNSNDILKLNSESGEFFQPPRTNIGVVTAAIRNKTNINAKNSRYHPNFSFNGDPLPDEPILISTYEIEDCIFATVLRGKTVKSIFTIEEESKLEAVMPYISRSLLYSINVTKKDTQQRDPFEIQLVELLDSAALFSTQLTLDSLVKTIQEKSAKIVNAKSSRFILYDHISNQFIFNNGNANLPGNLGLTGNVASFGSPIRITSPMSDSRFDKQIDLNIHQVEEINSMLIVPVYSQQEKVIGVLSLVNKIKNSEFSEEDEKTIITIAQLSSLSIQNSKIFETSKNLTQKLNDFVQIKKDKKNDSILIKILKKAKEEESKIYRVTLFLSNNNESLLLYKSIGGPLEQGTRFSLPALQQSKTISYPINDDYTERTTVPLSSRISRYSSYQADNKNSIFNQSPKKPSKSETINKNSSREKVDAGTSPSPNQSGRLICCTPISFLENGKNDTFGVLEIAATSIYNKQEIDLFENFCKIVVLSIKKEAKKDLIQKRNENFDLHDFIPENELDSFSIPSCFKEKIPEDLYTSNFDVTKVDSKSLFNIAFSIFDKFNLLNEFKINASKLFLFFYRIKSLLNDEKNWRNSIETASFLSYLLLTTKFNEKILPYELLSLIISSFCHKIEEQKLKEKIKNDSNFDILYSKSSVFESFTCYEIISIISEGDSNLIENVNADKIAICKELIINLILSTDYYKHYLLVHDLKELTTSDNINFDINEKNRLLIMKIFLKMAIVGVIARNHEVADKYRESICDDFYIHGPFDKAREIVFTSSLQKDRSHIDKQKSRNAVLDSVFAPTFRLIVKIFPNLNEIFNSLSDNISRWNSKRFISENESNRSNSSEETNKKNLGPDRMFENE